MFIGRKEDNSIYGAWTVRQWEGQEELADEDPELVAFLALLEPPPLTPAQKLASIGLTVDDLRDLIGT